MNNFPGGFPGLYPAESISATSDSTPTRNSSNPSLGTPSLSVGNLTQREILIKSIKSRKKVFKNELISNLDLLCFLYFVLCYLYDCSLLILITRSLTQFSIMVLQHSPLLQGFFSRSSGKKSTFNLLIVTTALIIISHLTSPLPKPNDDGFVYGHHTLQAIGQYQLPSKYWLLGYDTVIFFLQIAQFSTQYCDRDSLQTKTSIRNSFDGFQGNINIIRIPVIDTLKMKRASIDDLKEDERLADQSNERIASQIDSLLNSNEASSGYGSTDQRDNPGINPF